MDNKSKKSILLVEDDPISSSFTHKVLEYNNYHVTAVRSGELAIEYIENGSVPDLILMDIDLGKGINGVEAAQRILQIRDLPIVFLTGYSTEAIVKETEVVSSYGFVVKSSGDYVLLASVKMALNLAEAKKKLESEYTATKIQEKYLETILKTTSDGFWVVDANRRIIDVNDYYCVLSGYSREEILNLTVTDLDAEVDPETMQKRIERIIKVGSEVFETKHRCKNGKIIDVEISVTYFPEKGEKFVCFCRDISERKANEKLLIESETKYRQLVESLHDAVFSLDINGTINYVNQAVCQILKYTPGDVLGKHYLDLVFQEDRNYIQEEVSKVMKGSVAPCEYRMLTKEGEIRWVYSSSSPEIIKGKITGILGILTDITERKHVEEKLRESEERYRAIAEYSHSAICVVNESARIIWVNPQMSVISGYSDEHLLNVGSFAELLAPESIPFVIDNFMKFVKGLPYEHHYMFSFIRSDGEKRLIEKYMTDYRDKNGAKNLIISMLDITEHKLAEDKIALLAQMTDTAPSSIIVHSFNGDIFYANQRAFEMHQYSEKEFMNLKVSDIDIPEANKLYEERIALIESGKEITFEVIHCKKDGTAFPLLVYAKKVFWKDNPAILSIATDISKQKQAEEEHHSLQQQITQAQKMESVGRLAGGIAHDFNNMLSVIMGNAEMVLDEITPESPLYQDIIEIKNAAKRSAELTKQLLAFARKQTVTPVKVDLNKAVEKSLKMIRRLIGEDISLLWNPDHELWFVKLDYNQIDQVLTNLCLNARDAINGVGKITINTANTLITEKDLITLPDITLGEYVLLSVSDNGCGMGKDILGKLFEPFFTTKEMGKGTGLGLATVYGIIKQNLGSIHVFSEVGKGTVFEIFFPRYHAEEVDFNEEISEAVNHGTETILLVEDEDSIMKMAKNMLSRMGYKVLAAVTVEEALEVTTDYRGKIDLIITDVVMPRLNGRELVTLLQKYQPEMKCLYMSGYTADVIALHGVLEKGLNFIQKPFTMKELGIKTREILKEKNLVSSGEI